MTELYPRSFTHSGLVTATGVLLRGPTGDAQRALGLSVHQLRTLATDYLDNDELLVHHGELEDLIVHRFAAPRLVRAERCSGEPLLSIDQHWVSLPLTPAQVHTLDLPTPHLLFARQGKLVSVPIASLVTAEVAGVIDVGDFEPLAAQSLAPPPAPVQIIKPQLVTDERDAIGGALPQVSPELTEFVATMKSRRGATLERTKRPNTSPLPGFSLGLRALLFLALLLWLRVAGRSTGGMLFVLLVLGMLMLVALVLLAVLKRPTAQDFTLGEPRHSHSAPPQRPRSASALQQALKRWWLSMAHHTGLSRLLMRNQSAYLQKMFKLFDDGNLDEALKHAIPTSKKLWDGDLSSLKLSGFKVRSSLDFLNPKASHGGTTLGSADLLSQMRQLYRRAFEQLVKAERHQEAAFVLAELLDEAQEAVAFLEQHNLIEQAAKLAEVRELDPALIIRLWLRCGATDRAVALALRHRAFAATIKLMESSGRDVEADKLRLIWADRLASGGDYLQACDIAWPATQARAVVLKWLESGCALGGLAGGRAIAFAAGRKAFEFKYLERLTEVYLEQAGEHAAVARQTLGSSLLLQDMNSEVSRLGGSLLRKMLIDCAQGQGKPQTLTELAHRAGDLMYVDMPPLPEQKPWEGAPYTLKIEAQDHGDFAVFDAAVLDDFTALVALGEAGVLHVDAKGKTLHHYDVVTHKLVVSDHYTRALALTINGSLTRVTRLELEHLQMQHWMDLHDAQIADTFDGQLVHLTHRSRLVAVDATQEGVQAVWTSDAYEHPIVAVQNLKKEVVVTTHIQEEQRLRLSRYRKSGYGLIRWDESDAQYAVPMARGIGEIYVREQDCLLQLGVHKSVFTAFGNMALVSSDSHLAVWGSLDNTNNVELELHGVDSPACLSLNLEQGERAQARLFGGRLHVCDKKGRVLAIDLETGQCCFDVRVKL